MEIRRHLIRPQRSSSSESSRMSAPSSPRHHTPEESFPRKKRLRRESIPQDDLPSTLFSDIDELSPHISLISPPINGEKETNPIDREGTHDPKKIYRERTQKLQALAKHMKKQKIRQRRASLISFEESDPDNGTNSYSGSEEEEEEEESSPIRNIKRTSFSEYFSKPKGDSEVEEYIEGEFDDFICDDDDEPEIDNEELGYSSGSEREDYSPSDEISLRREYEELQEKKLSSMESLSFVEAFKRYVMYLALCLFSPNFQYPFPTDSMNGSPGIQEEDQTRSFDFSYFQPAIDKIEKFILAKRDQYDTKPFPREFKNTLSLYPNLTHQEVDFWEDHEICQACKSHRGIRYVINLDGTPYHSAKIWSGDISEWYRASQAHWLGIEAFNEYRDPTLDLEKEIPTYTPNTLLTRSYKNCTLSKNGKLNQSPAGVITRCEIPVGPHCCKQAKMWHHLHHYKFFLLNCIYKKLSKSQNNKLQNPLIVAKDLKKDKCDDLYKGFQSEVISAAPTQIK